MLHIVLFHENLVLWICIGIQSRDMRYQIEVTHIPVRSRKFNTGQITMKE